MARLEQASAVWDGASESMFIKAFLLNNPKPMVLKRIPMSASSSTRVASFAEET